MTTTKPPTGLRTPGRRLWSSVADEYDLEEHESAVLLEAARTVDLLETLNTHVQNDGAIIDTPQGTRAHPAAVEARQQRIALARLLAVLRLPSGDEYDSKPGARPQRRSGVRGPYSIRPGA
jgi:hypothetical protein